MARDKMFAEVVIAGSYRNLSKATKGATKEMQGFGKSAKKISMGVKAAWAGGIAIALDFLWDGLKKVGKAAAEEAQSVALLQGAMDKSWKATDTMSKAQEEFIQKMSYSAVIADEKLRPAYAKLVRSTKSSEKAQRAFSIALDIAAEKGKDINVVSQAMARFLAGDQKALNKLVPELRNVGDKFGYLEKQYAGAAKTMGDAKPFEKVELIFGDIQDRLGGYILPYVQKFADYLAGPEAKKMIDKMFASVQNMFDYLETAEGKKYIQGIADGFIGIGDAMASMAKYLSETKWFWDAVFAGQANTPLAILGRAFAGEELFVKPGGNKPAAAPGQNNSPGSIVYNIYGVASGQDVIKAIKGEATKKGRTVLGLLTNG
jgi:hypothetical protein